MSYEKQTWTTGETITAEKLNHLEDGVASAGSGGGGSTATVIYDASNFFVGEEEGTINGEVIDEIAQSWPLALSIPRSNDTGGGTKSITTVTTIFYLESLTDMYTEYDSLSGSSLIIAVENNISIDGVQYSYLSDDGNYHLQIDDGDDGDDR